MNDYIIVEVIPESLSPKTGNLVQLSALKVVDNKIIDRFDYRLKKDNIKNIQLLEITDYDNDSFVYLESTLEILDNFQNWIEEYKILMLDNEYTNAFLEDIKNEKESITEKLNLKYTDDIIDTIIEKYNLQPSNYIVDLLYEALIYEREEIE